MALPVDDPGDEHRIQLPAITGGYSFHAAVFRYDDPNAPPALSVAPLRIEPGEKVAILGRNGAGKSTLLQGCSGLLQPISGEVLLDDFALHHIDPADVRHEVGLLGRARRRCYGTILNKLT